MKAYSIIPILMTAMLLSACGEGSSDKIKGAKYSSMKTCLEGVKKNTGSHNLTIYTDKPEKVSGSLENGKTFACELKKTGSEGTYYEGWWFYAEK